MYVPVYHFFVKMQAERGMGRGGGGGRTLFLLMKVHHCCTRPFLRQKTSKRIFFFARLAGTYTGEPSRSRSSLVTDLGYASFRREAHPRKVGVANLF